MNRRAFLVLLCVAAFGCAGSTASAVFLDTYTGTFTGEIVRIIGNTIQVRIPKVDKAVSFWTDEKTKITRDKTVLKFADLKVGQTVTVDASRGRAKTIKVEGPASTN
ncbi:MAG TPA: hypothetical protein PK402_09575 [Tepidisphaeraceae bacterium]|nr:hypothetical protein [Tepidisphaeraceae bacterium]